jgi:glycosyltransferase involved in cell wall biosynthesis
VSEEHNGTRRSAPFLVWINQFAVLPSDGGGTRHFELGRELVRRGWRVTILASDLHLHRRVYTRRRDPLDKQPVVETIDGVELRWLWAAPYQANNWRRGWNWLSFARSVRRDRGAFASADVVIGSSPQLFGARAGRDVARAAGARFVLEIRDLWPESLLAAGGRIGPGYRLMDRVARALYRDAEWIIVLARGVEDYLVGKGVPRQKFRLIPNGVDVGSVDPTSSVRAQDGPFTLVYAGAHGPANGLEQLLDAAAILGPDAGVRFVLVGDGPSKDHLRQDAIRRTLGSVEFVDPLSKPELMSLLTAADAGLMLLRDAPLFSFAVSPNKLFDYLAAGLPVVCNVPGDVARLLADANAGIQTSDASGRSLADAIGQLRGLDRDARRRMGLAGRRFVEREHSRDVLGARLDRFLREVIHR